MDNLVMFRESQMIYPMDMLSAVMLLASFSLFLYTYLGYPALLWLLDRLVRREDVMWADPPEWPYVSVLLSAYDEEEVIDARLQNLLALDYPRERLEILVGSDGCTDRTCEIAGKYAKNGVRLFAFEERRGKTSVLNDLVVHARGEVLVFTDANTFFEPDALRCLIRGFVNLASACAVVGRVDLRSSASGGNLDGIYWRYETWLKKLESRFGALLGANGPIYAVRKNDYRPLPREAIVDDFLIPIFVRLHRGGRIFFVPSARAWEISPQCIRDEFRRRVRIGAGDLQALFWTWRLLLPSNGMAAFAYFSHKVVRWLGPWLLLVAFVANLTLLDYYLFRLLFWAQIGFYAVALGAGLFRRVPILGALASGFRYFIVLNAGLLLGFARFALGIARPFWSRTPRTPVFRESPTSQ